MTLLNDVPVLQQVLHDTLTSPDLLFKPKRGEQQDSLITAHVLDNHIHLSFSFLLF